MGPCSRRLQPLNSSWWSPSNCAAVACFAHRGGCPSSSWKDAIAPAVSASAAGPLVLVNAGANKGYAVAEFVQRFGSATFTARDWLNNLTAIKSNMMLPCGFCKACQARAPTSRRHPGPIHAHAVELMPGNVAVLELMYSRMHVPGKVHALALSNYSGEAYRSSVFRTGEEDMGAMDTPQRHSVKVRSLTLEDWAREHGVRQVDLLSLDAEGWDLRILRGAASLLTSKRISVVEFELAPSRWVTAAGVQHWWTLPSAPLERNATHPGLLWATRELHATVSWLSELGYSCFWQGRDEEAPLLDATPESLGACTPNIAKVAQANLVCAHSALVLERMRALRIGWS